MCYISCKGIKRACSRGSIQIPLGQLTAPSPNPLAGFAKRYKKLEIMLTKRAKAYSSSYSQTVSLSPAISLQFILGMCAAAKDCKNQQKPLILKVQGLSKSLMLIRLKSSSLVLVVIGSIPMPICNHFHKRLANNGKIMTFTGVSFFDALMHRFSWT